MMEIEEFDTIIIKPMPCPYCSEKLKRRSGGYICYQCGLISHDTIKPLFKMGGSNETLRGLYD